MRFNKVPIHWLTFSACNAVLLGIFLAKFGYQLTAMVVAVSIVSLPLVLNRRLPALVAVFGVFFCLGALRGAHIHNQLNGAEQLFGGKVKLVGRVSNDPIYHKSGQLEFRVSNARIGEQAYPGTIRIRGFISDVLRGDIVSSQGKLRDGFGPLSGSMSYSSIDIIERSASPTEKLRRQFMSGINSNMPDPESSLGLGFLLGTRSILPESLTVALSATGLTHIVAVSGYNLTIIVNMMRRLFLKRSRYLSLISSLLLLAGFIALAGSSPSVNRAAVVSVLSLVGWYYGRRSNPIILLWASAAITAYWQPLYLWSDIGWYLSFCAFFGVLILAPLVNKKLFPQKSPGLIGSLAIETSMAQLCTLPLIMLIFKDVSVISLLANILVLPLIPISMLLTFAAGIAGMIMPSIAAWLSWPAFMLLSYMVNLINWLSRLPWALQSIAITPLHFGIIWLVILIIWHGLAKATKNRQLKAENYQSTDDRGILTAI